MRGDQIRLRKRLESLQRAAAGGNEGAAGEARLLAIWLEDEATTSRKRQDDRCKVLVGALMGNLMASGRPVVLNDRRALLDAMDSFLSRPTERMAVLGPDGNGSEAFHRVFGSPPPAD
ncbi:hypothetical protein D3C77_214230 [compost metagenome]